MILFSEIYNKAINLFDDPEIQRAYVFDTVRFEKIMYTYLQNGLNRFTNPTKVAFLLADQEDPIGMMEIFTDGQGTEPGKFNKVVLETTPKENAKFSYTVAGRPYNKATYDATTKTVTFADSFDIGTEVSVEWYYCGCFRTDFSAAASSAVPANIIRMKVIDILSRALVIAWAEDEQNFLLDIKNVLTDTDFKIYSPANSIKAKTEWVKQLKFDFDTIQTKLAWDVFSVRYHGGSYYGR